MLKPAERTKKRVKWVKLNGIRAEKIGKARVFKEIFLGAKMTLARGHKVKKGLRI